MTASNHLEIWLYISTMPPARERSFLAIGKGAVSYCWNWDLFRPSILPVRGSGDVSTSALPGAGSCSSSARHRPCSPPLCHSVLHHLQQRPLRECLAWCCGHRWHLCPATAGAWQGFQFWGVGHASAPPPWRGPGRSLRWWWWCSSSGFGFSLLQGLEKRGVSSVCSS